MSTEETKARETYNVKLKTPLEFEGISSTKYVTSNELVKMFSDIMRSAFADFEGCIFEPAGREPSVSILFNKGDFGDSHVATTKYESDNKTNFEVINRSRANDQYATNGDKFTLSEDGKDVLLPLISRAFFSSQGKPNMGQIVTEWVDPVGAPQGFFMMPQQRPVYTRVNGITLQNICKMLYGGEADGEDVAYMCSIASVFNQTFGGQQMPANGANYVLRVERVISKTLNELLAKLGIRSGANIIR